MNADYLIIGSGIAAQSAIEAIRKNDITGTIELFSKEQSLSAKKTMLSKTPLKRVRTEGLTNHGQEWFDLKNVNLHLGESIAKISPKEHKAVTETGEEIYYRKCIYALGGHSFIPDIKGKDKEGIVAIHNEADLRKLKRLALGKNKIAIIGGGVIGLELAIELRKYQMEVTVLELAPYLMPGKLDKESSDRLISLLDAIRVETGVKIKEITGKERATGILLEDGRKVDSDVVVISCGQIAETELAKDAGIAVNRGVLVDERMQTSEHDIYAAGDCAEFEGMNYALWTQAMAQGKVAGHNASCNAICNETNDALNGGTDGETNDAQGNTANNETGNIANGYNVIGKFDHTLVLSEGDASICSIGDLGMNKNLSYIVERFEKEYHNFSINEKPKKAYETRYYVKDQLVGGCIVGNLSGMRVLVKEVEEGSKRWK